MVCQAARAIVFIKEFIKSDFKITRPTLMSLFLVGEENLNNISGLYRLNYHFTLFLHYTISK